MIIFVFELRSQGNVDAAKWVFNLKAVSFQVVKHGKEGKIHQTLKPHRKKLQKGLSTTGTKEVYKRTAELEPSSC